jgi:hypothetical protein
MSKDNKEIEKFLEDLANNTPNENQFGKIVNEKNLDEFEEDLMGGKSFKTLKNSINKKRGKK